MAVNYLIGPIGPIGKRQGNTDFLRELSWRAPAVGFEYANGFKSQHLAAELASQRCHADPLPPRKPQRPSRHIDSLLTAFPA